VIVEIGDLLDKEHYGISFSVSTDDMFVAKAGLSCGAVVEYQHSWSSDSFKFEVSMRERPVLPLTEMQQIHRSYFDEMEVRPGTVGCLKAEEMLAEKLRASYQRARARDLYDLVIYSEMPIDKDTVRSLVVLKCWSVRDEFRPDQFFERLASGRIDWSDLRRLVRRDQWIESEDCLKQIQSRYRFLDELTEDEETLAEDARRHARIDLEQRVRSKLTARFL
jgi:hypothetical protein